LGGSINKSKEEARECVGMKREVEDRVYQKKKN
jgi:hypothetical protein